MDVMLSGSPCGPQHLDTALMFICANGCWSVAFQRLTPSALV